MKPAVADILTESVAHHMRRDSVTLHVEMTVGECLEQLRRQDLGERIVYFYVRDDEGRIAGVLPTRRLLMSRPEVAITSIMVPRIITVPENASVLEACRLFMKHKLLAFPVVDAEQRMVGVVDVSLFTDELTSLSEKQAADDVFQLIGVHLAARALVSPLRAFRGRFPWLLCNIAGGLACALLSGLFEPLLGTVIVLALFIPVVLALAESVSIQSMTITLQNLHSGPITTARMARAVVREMKTALLLGFACGSIVGIAAWMWRGQAGVGMAVGVSIVAAICTACLLGVVLPTVVRALKVDPRIAAGPIVLATTDMATLIFYFGIARIILSSMIEPGSPPADGTH